MSYRFSKFLDYPCFWGQRIHCWYFYRATMFGSRHVMSRNHVSSRKSRHVTSCYVMSRNFTLCHVMSRHVTSCHVLSRHVTSRLATSCHVMPCHVMLRHGTSCHVESRGTVTRPTLHCQLTFSTRNSFELSMTVFVGWLSRRLSIPYRISGIWSSLT